jgi:hypothetical protein
MKLIAFSQLRNELSNGNLENWFNSTAMCDYRYIYDQNSDDGSKEFYKPFPPEESQQLRAFYISLLSAPDVNLPLDGRSDFRFYNKSGTLIANGYTRVCVGDYGPYIEISPDQIVKENIKNRWSGKPHRYVKYIWMETIDAEKTKIYYQKAKVEYADYQIEMYYVDPRDVQWEGEIK